MRWLLVAVAAVVTGAVAFAEVTMRPSAPDRYLLYSVYGATAALTVLSYWAISRVATAGRSLRQVIASLALASTTVVAVAVVLAAVTMFLSAHDRDLLLVALSLGVALALSLAGAVSRGYREDLDRIKHAAERFAGGDRSARASLARRDELGQVGEAFDRMAGQVAAAERERQLFLSGVGHDLRTPLASLRAAIEAIQDGVVTDVDGYLVGMALDVEHLTKLVEDFFLLSRLETGRFEPAREWINLMELGDETVEALTPLAAQTDVRLTVEGDVEAAVQADATGLGRVVRNLVDNAIRHSPHGGTVRIEVREGLVRVTDEGPGFDADARRRAFDRFYRGDPSRSGPGSAGLGLAIARGIVEAHGGSIEIDPGSGGSVTVRI